MGGFYKRKISSDIQLNIYTATHAKYTEVMTKQRKEIYRSENFAMLSECKISFDPLLVLPLKWGIVEEHLFVHLKKVRD